jgi:hypothetical protein
MGRKTRQKIKERIILLLLSFAAIKAKKGNFTITLYDSVFEVNPCPFLPISPQNSLQLA